MTVPAPSPRIEARIEPSTGRVWRLIASHGPTVTIARGPAETMQQVIQATAWHAWSRWEGPHARA